MPKLDRMGRDDLFYKIVDQENEKAMELPETVNNINFQDKDGNFYLHVAARARSCNI